ncbi:MAG: lactate utilization protein [Thermodesulfobacteriota bacterium]
MGDHREQEIQTAIKALKSNRFEPVEIVETAIEAGALVLSMIPPEAKVGMGGSTTLMQLGIFDDLLKKGQLTRSRPDIYLTGSNAITADGKLVNTDMTGNRVTNMIFGPKLVIVVAGINKVVADVPSALCRIKNVIAPAIARNAGLKTPCSLEGKCTDCKSPFRVCTVTTIIEAKPRMTQISIILVKEDLGLGWDPNWDEGRKERIFSVFKEKWAQLAATREQR